MAEGHDQAGASGKITTIEFERAVVKKNVVEIKDWRIAGSIAMSPNGILINIAVNGVDINGESNVVASMMVDEKSKTEQK